MGLGRRFQRPHQNSGIVLTLTTVLGLGVTWQVRVMMNRTLISELQERGHSVISDLAARSADPILLNDTFALHELLTETVTNHSDAVYAFVLNPQGQVLAHTFSSGVPTGLLSLNDMKVLRILGTIGVPLAVAFHGSVGALFGVVGARPY